MTIHAIIVGINTYKTPLIPLNRAVLDAQKIKNVLMNTLNAQEENITLLLDSDATKEKIMDNIIALTSKAKRRDPIIFYFSGYAAKAKRDDDRVGVICNSDVLEKGGIPDDSLVMVFDQVAKACGNNITLLLDCPATYFDWKIPTSCVIVLPWEASEGEHGGTFTQALVNVLIKQPPATMTVRAFAGRIGAETGIKIVCVGSKVNRPLFDVNGPEGCPAFIPGLTLKNGTISLRAGAAHGVRVNAVYGIYSSNILKHAKRLGELYVAAHVDSITSTLCNGTDGFRVPCWFYAVEERNYFDAVKISFSNPQMPTKFSGLRGWEAAQSNATVAVAQYQECLTVTWSAFDSPAIEGKGPIVFLPKERSHLQADIIRIARFHSQLYAPPAGNASFSDQLTVRFQAKSSDLFEENSFGDKFIMLDLKEGGLVGPCILTIMNENDFDLWPYIFLYDAEGFEIGHWYIPPPGSEKSPLKANDKIVLGNNINEGQVMFRYKPDRDYGFQYFKIYVTRNRTDFSFFSQGGLSKLGSTTPTSSPRSELPGDRVRCLSSTIEKNDKYVELPSPDSVSRGYLTKADEWNSMRVTIQQKFLRPKSACPKPNPRRGTSKRSNFKQ